jgi:hypothetical protein
MIFMHNFEYYVSIFLILITKYIFSPLKLFFSLLPVLPLYQKCIFLVQIGLEYYFLYDSNSYIGDDFEMDILIMKLNFHKIELEILSP